MISIRHKAEVIVIGSGIVGLMCAYQLEKAGFSVTVFDAGPDPTSGNYDRSKAGTTFRGGNARHISATETCPHATASRSGIIYKPTWQGGWLAKDPAFLTPSETKWMADFEYFTTQSSLIDNYMDDTAYVNNLGKKLWKKLKRENRDLFKNTGVKHRVSVFFLDQKTFESEADFEDKYNPSVRRLYPKNIKKTYPGLEYACQKGIIAGGIEEDCIAINAIDFCVNVIQYLKAKGVEFRWGERVVEITTAQDSKVIRLVTERQEAINAEYYVISTGYFSQNLVSNTKCAGKIMGVTGVWIHIPNPDFKGSFKIDAPEPTGYINATLKDKTLAVSGGYGFIGNDNLDLESPGIQALFSDMEGVIKKIFPESYDRALREGSLDRRACVRPMTAYGLGVFEALPTSSGGKAIIIGANSAGGFTQAPAIAQAVVEVMKGEIKSPIPKFFDLARTELEANR